MTNRLNYSYLDHPTLRQMPRNNAEWAEYNRVILETAGNVVQGLLDDGQVGNQSFLPMVTVGNKGSVVTGGVLPLTATDAGASTTINIAAHTVRFDFADVAYNSGSITGLLYSTVYYVYADDKKFQGGSVAYLALTEPDDLTQNVGRYFVGEVTTPAPTASDTTGGGGAGAGGGGGGGGYVWP